MTKKKQKLYLNIGNLLADVSLLCMAVIFTNSIRMAGDKFSWTSVGILLSGFGLVGVLLYMKHLNWKDL